MSKSWGDGDRYIAALAAEEETLEPPEDEDTVIPLAVACRLCGTLNSVETWDGERRPVPQLRRLAEGSSVTVVWELLGMLIGGALVLGGMVLGAWLVDRGRS